MSDMIGLILAAGAGTRLKPLTDNAPKALLSLGGRPLLSFALEQMQMCGIEEVAVSVEGRFLDQFVQAQASGAFGNFVSGIKFVVDPRAPGGIPSAIYAAEDEIAGRRVFLTCSDLLFEDGLQEAFLQAKNEAKGGVVFAAHLQDTAGYGLLTIDKSCVLEISNKDKNQHEPGFVELGTGLFDETLCERAAPYISEQHGFDPIYASYAESGQLRFARVSGWWSDTGGSIEQFRELEGRFRRKFTEAK